MSDYISKSTVIELIESKMTDGCLGTEEDTFIGGHGLVDDISDLPALDEKEIIRKVFERVIKKMEEKEADYRERAKEELDEMCLEMFHLYESEADGIKDAIEIVKEECGINE